MLRPEILLFISVFGICSSLPSNTIIRKLDPGLRYQYALDSKGDAHLVDLWMSLSDLKEAARYDPAKSNVYHLFTRENPTTSQPLLINNVDVLNRSNFNRNRRTIVLIHGWRDSATSDFNSVMVPAFLAAENVNVIVVDWSVGSSSINYRAVVANTVTSGAAVAKFIKWLNEASGSTPVQYHIVGHGFGGQQVGIVGRNLGGKIAYITGLDPAILGWAANINRFDPLDGQYTEVIHTNYGVTGYIADLAQVDFYPNGGISMPGCNSNSCDHDRSFHYLAESIQTEGFTGRQCVNYQAAILGFCDLLPIRLQMGGLRPKFGRTGVFLLETNPAPPFSMG